MEALGCIEPLVCKTPMLTVPVMLEVGCDILYSKTVISVNGKMASMKESLVSLPVQKQIDAKMPFL